MRGIENSVAKYFGEYFIHAALQQGFMPHTFPLDGQDRDVGADYLFSDSTNFALIEFKSYEDDIASEKKKPRRRTLCQLLPITIGMQNLHDRCHFIGWLGGNGTAIFNIYRKEVCNRRVFDDHNLPAGALVSSRQPAKDFTTGFLEGHNSLDFGEFETYLEWLMKDTSGSDSGSDSGSISVVAMTDENECILKEFNSLKEIHQWMQQKLEMKMGGPAPN